jgi:hypothetical protein
MSAVTGIHSCWLCSLYHRSLPLVLAPARALAGLAPFSRSPRPTCHTRPGGRGYRRPPTEHLPSGSAPLQLASVHGDAPMNPQAEKLALFRYGLIAPLVIESLPRGELSRRAKEIAARQYDIPDSRPGPSPSVRCWNGPSVTAAPAWKRSRPSRGGTAVSRELSLPNWPLSSNASSGKTPSHRCHLATGTGLVQRQK